MPAPLEELVEEFVRAVVDSFEKLEILLTLSSSEHALSVDAIAAAAHIDERMVRDEANELVEAGVLTRTGEGGAASYTIDRGGAWAKHVDALRALHEANRMKVITLMSDAALRRLRDKADRIFADAFVIGTLRKKDPKKDGE